MTRRELRENVFKMLFRVEFFDAGELSEQLVLFGEEVDHVTDQDFKYIADRYRDIYNHLTEIDEARLEDNPYGQSRSGTDPSGGI